MKKIRDFFRVAGCRLPVASLGRGIGKRGGLLDEESVKVIMAVAVFAGIVYLMVKLFAPVFNEADEVAESYFEMLEGVMDEQGIFFMLDNGKDDLNFYLVYFGDVVSFGEDKVFTRKPDGKKNVLCVCSESGDDIICRHCDDVGLPVKLANGGEQWAVGEGVRMRISKGDFAYGIIRLDTKLEKTESVGDPEDEGIDTNDDERVAA